MKGGGGIGVADVHSGTDGDSGPLGWRGTVRCFWQRKKNQSVVGKEGRVPQEKKNPLGNRTPWWRNTVDMKKAV